MRSFAITCLVLGIAACQSGPSSAVNANEAGGLDGFTRLPAVTGLELGTNEPKGSRFYHASEARIRIDVREFWICRNLVTAAEYCEFLNSEYARGLAPAVLCVTDEKSWYRWANIEHVDGVWQPRRACAQAPAWTATWRGAVEYCEWRSRNDSRGVRYRLPTEAEWEYAARGVGGRAWPWGDEPPTPERGHRWNRHPWNDAEPWLQLLCDVGCFPAGATPEGVLDLMDWREWCVNVFKSRPLASDLTATTVSLPEDSVLRVGEWRWNLDHSGTSRAVRGPDRMDIEKPYAGVNAWRIVVALLIETDTTPCHEGRVWSRAALDPSERCAFRLVADLPSEHPLAAR